MSREPHEAMTAGASRAPSVSMASAAVAAFALVVVLLYDPWHQPLLNDSAYLVYMAQALLRGELLYEATTFGYAPLTQLLAATAMKLGTLIGVPDYMAPRAVGVPLAAASAAMLCLVTARFGGRIWTGVVAGVTLTVFDPFNAFAAANLEPKLLVLFLALVAVAATQARRWWVVGLASSLATTAWQAAGFLGLAMLILVLANRKERAGWAVWQYMLGAGLGLAPVALYLLHSGQVEAFVQQAVLFKLDARPEIVGGGWPHPLSSAISLMQAIGLSAAPVLLVAGGAAAAYVVRQAKRPRAFLSGAVNPSGGGIVVMTLAWAAYATVSAVMRVEFLNFADVLAFAFLIAFWFAEGCDVMATKADRAQWRLRGHPIPVRRAVGIILATVSLAKAATYRVRLPLEQEVLIVRETIGDGPFLAINLPEHYVITGAAAPWRSLYVTPYFMQFWEHEVGVSCQELQDALQHGAHERILVRTAANWNQGCLTRLVSWLEARYPLRSIAAGFGYDASCGTTALLGLRRRSGLPGTAPPDPRRWTSCILQKIASSYQFGDRGEILVFDRASRVTPEGAP